MSQYSSARDTLIRLASYLGLAAIVSVQFACGGGSDAKISFALSFPEARSAEALDGRMLLLISTNDQAEPRFQIQNRGKDTQLAFGLTVDGLPPGDAAIMNHDEPGYPLKSIAEIPPGEYWVQGLLNRYETFNRSDGHVVKLPPDKG